MKEKIEELIKSFYSNDSIQQKNARYELVKIGTPVVEYLSGLLNAPKERIRWEAIKTLSQIAAPESIPILINALENEDFDVRWLAAEGLIEIGKMSIKPLLEKLVSNHDSKFFLESAHHVLKGLQFKKLYKDDYEIIKKIEHYNSHSKIALAAEDMLLKMETKNRKKN